MRLRIEPGGFATIGGAVIVNASPFERTYCLRRRSFEWNAQAVQEAIGQRPAFDRFSPKTVGSRRHEPRKLVSQAEGGAR